jgi:hypothetical protein
MYAGLLVMSTTLVLSLYSFHWTQIRNILELFSQMRFYQLFFIASLFVQSAIMAGKSNIFFRLSHIFFLKQVVLLKKNINSGIISKALFFSFFSFLSNQNLLLLKLNLFH